MYCPGQNNRIVPLSFFHGYRKRQLPPEIDSKQTVIGLPPATSAVFFIA
jgi:hypothetical protein